MIIDCHFHLEEGLLARDELIERMDASFLCGPESEPAYCLTDETTTPGGTSSTYNAGFVVHGFPLLADLPVLLIFMSFTVMPSSRTPSRIALAIFSVLPHMVS